MKIRIFNRILMIILAALLFATFFAHWVIFRVQTAKGTVQADPMGLFIYPVKGSFYTQFLRNPRTNIDEYFMAPSYTWLFGTELYMLVPWWLMVAPLAGIVVILFWIQRLRNRTAKGFPL